MHCLTLAAVLLTVPGGAADWRAAFPVEAKNLSPAGGNPHFVLKPGLRLHSVTAAPA
jgi:hypothetical protein